MRPGGPVLPNGVNDLRNFRFRSTGNNDPMAFDSKPLRDRGAESLFGADPHNNSGALKRGHCNASTALLTAQSAKLNLYRSAGSANGPYKIRLLSQNPPAP
jgi:hypothetical protein